jgi:hypothetical protein
MVLDSCFRRDFKAAYNFTFRDKNFKYTSKSVRHIRNKESVCPIIVKLNMAIICERHSCDNI